MALSCGYTGASRTFGILSFLAAIAVAIVALARRQRPLGRWLPAVLAGAWFASFEWFVYDVLSVPAYKPFSGSARVAASYVIGSIGDALGIVVTILLLVVLRRSASRGPWATPRVLPVLMLAGMVAGWLCWQVAFLHALDSGDHWGSNLLHYDYPYVGQAVAGIIVAVVAALIALGIPNRVLGGAVVAGYAGMSIFWLLVFYTGALSMGRLAALDVVSLILLAATGVLAIVYAKRKQAS